MLLFELLLRCRVQYFSQQALDWDHVNHVDYFAKVHIDIQLQSFELGLAQHELVNIFYYIIEAKGDVLFSKVA